MNRNAWLFGGALLAAVSMGLSPASAQRRRGIPITIESTPAGATVHVGSAEGDALGTTPLRNVRVPRGEQTLVFSLEGHETHEERITVRRRRARYSVTLERQARLTVTAAAASATGAAVSVNGQPVGTLPHEMVVPAGRHLVHVERDGYVAFEQWVDVRRGEGVTLPILLEREPPRAGSVLVAGDVPGAQILIDGQARGTTPMVVDGLPEGPHQVEIRADGLPPHSEQVFIRAGQRATVSPDLRATGRGTLTVVADVEGALITIDGEVAGRSPVTVDDLGAGEHLVEASAPGHEHVTYTVAIEAGGRRALRVELPEEARPPGRLVIRGATPGASATVDGEARGALPLVLADLASGPHAIVVEAEGFETLRTTCEVQPGEDCVIEADLSGMPANVVVRALGVSGAEVWLDGARIGPVPFEGELPSGSHRLEVRAEGYESHVEQVMLGHAAEPRVFDLDLQRVQEGPTEEERLAEVERRESEASGAVTHGAAPLPVGLAAVDASVGWPYLAEARVGVGLLDFLDAGFAMRTFGRLTEFEARSRIGFRPIELLGVGGQVRLGGGVGPDDVNSWFISIEGLTSLYFGGHGAVTLWLALDLHTDQYAYAETDSSVMLANAGRQDMARFRLGGSLEWAIDRNWALFGNLEGILASSGGGRRVYGDILDIGNSDTQFYFRLGGTYKF